MSLPESVSDLRLGNPGPGLGPKRPFSHQNREDERPNRQTDPRPRLGHHRAYMFLDEETDVAGVWFF